MKVTFKRALVAALAAAIIAVPAFAAVPVLSSEAKRICIEGGQGDVRKAIKAGIIKTKSRDADGNTALMIASQRNAIVDHVNALLESGSKVNDRNNAGYTPLLLAAEFNPNEEVIESLCRAGADVGATLPGGVTPAMKAAEWGTAEVFEMLVTYGADLSATDDRGRTVIDYAHDSKDPYLIGIVERNYTKALKKS